MESDLEAQLCFEFDNLKSYVVEWCIRVVRVVQQNSVDDGCSQNNLDRDDHGSPPLQGQKVEDAVEMQLYDLPAGVTGNEVGVDHDDLPVSVPSTDQRFDLDGGLSGSSRGGDDYSPQCSVGLSHQLQSSVDLSTGIMIEAGGQQANFIATAQLGTPESGIRSPSSSPPTTSGCSRLGSEAGGSMNGMASVCMESREYARFLLNNQPMCSNAGFGYGEQSTSVDLNRPNPEDGLNGVISDISSGFSYNLPDGDSGINNSFNYNTPTPACVQSSLGTEADSKWNEEIPLNTPAKKTRNRNSTKNGKNPKVCEYCSRAFRDSYCVKRHIYSVHLDDKNFVCQLCPERFKSNQGLVGHMKKVHS